MGMNKKHTLCISVENNQELMNEIDDLIRARAKELAHSELDKVINEIFDKKVQALAHQYIIPDDVRSKIRGIVDSKKGNELVMQAIKETADSVIENYIKSNIKHLVERQVALNFQGLTDTRVIQAVIDAMMKKD